MGLCVCGMEKKKKKKKKKAMRCTTQTTTTTENQGQNGLLPRRWSAIPAHYRREKVIHARMPLVRSCVKARVSSLSVGGRSMAMLLHVCVDVYLCVVVVVRHIGIGSLFRAGSIQRTLTTGIFTNKGFPST